MPIPTVLYTPDTKCYKSIQLTANHEVVSSNQADVIADRAAPWLASQGLILDIALLFSVLDICSQPSPLHFCNTRDSELFEL